MMMRDVLVLNMRTSTYADVSMERIKAFQGVIHCSVARTCSYESFLQRKWSYTGAHVAAIPAKVHCRLANSHLNECVINIYASPR